MPPFFLFYSAENLDVEKFVECHYNTSEAIDIFQWSLHSCLLPLLNKNMLYYYSIQINLLP